VSLDELGSLHERLGMIPDLDPFGHLGWVGVLAVPGAIVVGGILLFAVKVAREERAVAGHPRLAAPRCGWTVVAAAVVAAAAVGALASAQALAFLPDRGGLGEPSHWFLAAPPFLAGGPGAVRGRPGQRREEPAGREEEQVGEQPRVRRAHEGLAGDRSGGPRVRRHRQRYDPQRDSPRCSSSARA
jgi:hypothetical protein